ncbi:MAG TPA: hypothetical protein VMU98_09010 [Acidimicrobiales bacterium]|nr:hypothetical protein [Acidimicrobiales bacterium]
MSDLDDSSITPNKTPSRRRRQSKAPRSEILGLNQLELRVSWAAAAFAYALALFTALLWARNQPTVTSAKTLANGSCPSGSHFVQKVCQEVTYVSKGSWEFRFFFILFAAVALTYFTWRKKRAGVATFSIFLGLGNGVFFGPLFLLLGVWLIMRAFRLQKYGDASFKGANRAAREQSAERRANRRSGVKSRDKSAATTSTRSTSPTPSKRYTPKKQSTRRR